MDRHFTWIEGTEAALKVLQNHPTATSVTIYIKNTETDAVISNTASYTDGEAVVEFDGNDTTTPGVYKMQVNENLSGGGIAKYGAKDCDGDGDCAFAYVTICESIDGGIS